MTCSDCKMVGICGRITDPLCTGEPCAHYVQWTSKNAWMTANVPAPKPLVVAHHPSIIDLVYDEDAYWAHICDAEDDAYNNREVPVWGPLT